MKYFLILLLLISVNSVCAEDIKSILSNAEIFLAEEKYEKAVEYYNKAAEYAESSGEYSAAAFAYNSLSLCYSKLNRSLEENKSIIKAISLYKKAGLENKGKMLFPYIKHLSTGESYNDILFNAIKSFHNNNIDAAIRLYKTALTSPLNEHVIEATFYLGLIYLYQKDYITSLDYFKGTEKLAVQLDDIEMKSDSYQFIGKCYFHIKRDEEAVSYLKKSITLYRELGNAEAESELIDMIGDCYFRTRDWAEAIKYHKIAYDYYSPKANDRQTLSIARSLALSFRSSRDIENALSYFNIALEIANRKNNPALSAKQLMDIGFTYELADNFQSAIKTYSDAIELIEKNQELKNNSYFRELFIDIAKCYQNLGDFTNSILWYDKAYKLGQKYNDNYLTGNSIMGSAVIYQNTYKNEKALDAYSKALKYFNEEGSIDSKLKMISIYSLMGTIYSTMSDYDSCIKILTEGLSLSQDIKNSSYEAKLLLNLSDLYYKRGDIVKTRKYISMAIESAEKGDNSLEIFWSYSNLIDIETETENYVEAKRLIDKIYYEFSNDEDKLYRIERKYSSYYKAKDDIKNTLIHLRKALFISEKQNNLTDKAINLQDIASCYDKNNNTLKSIEYYEKALSIFSKVENDSGCAAVNERLAFIYYKKGDLTLSVSFMEECIRIIENIRSNSKGKSRKTYTSSAYYYYQFLSVLYAISGDKNKSIDIAEQAKARYLADLIKDNSLLSKYNYPGIEEIQQEIDDEEIILFYSGIDNANSGILYTISSDSLNATIINKNSIISFYDKYKFTFNEEEKDIRRGLKVKKEKPVVSASNEEFNLLVSQYRTMLSSNTASDLSMQRELSRLFYDLLIAPAEHHLEGKKRLLIIPDGILSFIPFETLINKKSMYLIEDFTVSYIQSLQIWDILNKRNFSSWEKELYSFSQSDYSDPVKLSSPENLTEDEILFHLEKSPDNLKSVYNWIVPQRWSDLSGVKKEIEGIKSVFTDDSKTSSIENLKESKLKELSETGELLRYKMLHFAVHGYVNQDFPELSSLVLYQNEDDIEDGYFNVKEINNLKIKADFINLSACETGLGKLYSGEGVEGLLSSFLTAGTNNISVSLWPVSDNATQDFMISFYNNLKKNNKYAESLRKIKLDFIKSEYRDPFFWAPFVIYGQ